MRKSHVDKLVNGGVIESVPFADWAAPTVPVLKSYKTSVRICGDFKVIVNRCLRWIFKPGKRWSVAGVRLVY